MFYVNLITVEGRTVPICTLNELHLAIEKAINSSRATGLDCTVESSLTGEVIFQIDEKECYCAEIVKAIM